MLVATLLGLVQPATDLQQAAADAEAAGLPIVLYVSRSDCSFCRRFEEEVLNPLIRSGEFDQSAIFRELMWDAPRAIRNLSGAAILPEDLAAAYAAKVTPTVLFLDAAGREIVPRITGYPRSAFFSYYLEAAIREAGRLMRRNEVEP